MWRPSSVTAGLVGALARTRLAAASIRARASWAATAASSGVDDHDPGVAVHQQRHPVRRRASSAGPRPATAGMPSPRAMIEAWEVGPPPAVASASTRAGSSSATSAAPRSSATSTPGGRSSRDSAPASRATTRRPRSRRSRRPRALIRVVEPLVGGGGGADGVVPGAPRGGPAVDGPPRPPDELGVGQGELLGLEDRPRLRVGVRPQPREVAAHLGEGRVEGRPLRLRGALGLGPGHGVRPADPPRRPDRRAPAPPGRRRGSPPQPVPRPGAAGPARAASSAAPISSATAAAAAAASGPCASTRTRWPSSAPRAPSAVMLRAGRARRRW